ncbi:SapC family protein [Thermosulfurimonas sp. F29]|uniref:SapC family protein n=1 Tax=Thermosulfurimonas sp. F29 TaxID=2867247 RepID=UPI001C83C1D7|nr:SapC family protein [Thermosulfurimonas sp. F29]MBX6422742.1 SapC family protein [Thermosulfurimonas sp. F29]
MFKILKKMVPLEPRLHSGLGLVRPHDYGFAHKIEIVPIGFSEIVPCSMWYPVFIAKRGEDLGVFVFLGTGETNLFVNPDGTWKTMVIPNLIRTYPFSVRKEGDEYVVLVDEEFLREGEGAPLFEGETPTPYLENIRTELTNIALDLEKAGGFAREVFEAGLLKGLNIHHNFSFGTLTLRNALTADMQAFIKIQPEKLYHLNVKGYLSLLFAQNFSLRNLVLFEVFNSFVGTLPF